MSRITFCATREAMQRRLSEGRSADGQEPFALHRSSDIPGAIEALEAGRDVVANATAVAVGWSAPEGTQLELDDDMSAPGLEALRYQSEARVHRANSRTIEVQLLTPGIDLDARIMRGLEGKARDPFPGSVTVGDGPEVS